MYFFIFVIMQTNANILKISKSILRILILFLMLTVIKCLTFAENPVNTGLVMKGTASYYSSRFNGRRTSSGEIFNNKNYTAAHRSLPFGTYVMVTNLKNNKSVIVKINDRFYPRKSHLIDITMAAATEIDMIRQGRANIIMEVLEQEKVPGLVFTDSILSSAVTYKIYAGEISVLRYITKPKQTIQIPFSGN